MTKTIRVNEGDYERIQRVAEEYDISTAKAVTRIVSMASLGANEVSADNEDDDPVYVNPETGSEFTKKDVIDEFMIENHVVDPAIDGIGDHVAVSDLERVDKSEGEDE